MKKTTISPRLAGVTCKFTVKWSPGVFSWENATISPRWAGVAYRFTVQMKPMRILHEKTQRFLRGRWRREDGVYIYKEQRWAGDDSRQLQKLLTGTSCSGVGWGGLGMMFSFGWDASFHVKERLVNVVKMRFVPASVWKWAQRVWKWPRVFGRLQFPTPTFRIPRSQFRFGVSESDLPSFRIRVSESEFPNPPI